MRALVVYESMYGNTHAVAEAIGAGLKDGYEVEVLPVGDVTAEQVDEADLLVVGGPTHVHGMSRAATRKSAIEAATGHPETLALDPAADGPGVRDWLDGLAVSSHIPATSFDTRLSGPAVLTGRAAVGIARRLRRRGLRAAADPQSFIVDKQNRLRDGELDRAGAWGASIAARWSGESATGR